MRQLGTDIGSALLATTDKSQCVQLEGELGAGKTTLVAGVLAAFGVQGPVRSPTYTLVEPYEVTTPRRMRHLQSHAGTRILEELAIAVAMMVDYDDEVGSSRSWRKTMEASN